MTSTTVYRKIGLGVTQTWVHAPSQATLRFVIFKAWVIIPPGSPDSCGESEMTLSRTPVGAEHVLNKCKESKLL